MIKLVEKLIMNIIFANMHRGKEALKCNETSNIHFINLVFREFSDVIMVYKCSDSSATC